MKNNKVIIVSDIHLGSENCRASDFLKFLEENKTDLLIINGDFIDGWVLSKRSNGWKNKHTKVISKILDMSRKIPVIWIRGNHDEFVSDFMHMRLGKIQIEENYILDLGYGKKYFIFHGDVLDIFVGKWKWIGKIGAKGYELALFINYWYNKFRSFLGLPYYSISKDIKKGVKAAINFITEFEINAAKLAKVNQCNGVICGHIHKPEDRQIAGVHYLNSGDWVESLSAILIDQNNNITIKEY